MRRRLRDVRTGADVGGGRVLLHPRDDGARRGVGAEEEGADEHHLRLFALDGRRLRRELGDTRWLFNGVAGRLTLEPLRASAGPPSIVFMGDGLSLVKARLEKALALPAGAVQSAGTLAAPKPTIKVQFGQRLIECGVARGLSAGE